MYILITQKRKRDKNRERNGEKKSLPGSTGTTTSTTPLFQEISFFYELLTFHEICLTKGLV